MQFARIGAPRILPRFSSFFLRRCGRRWSYATPDFRSLGIERADPCTSLEYRVSRKEHVYERSNSVFDDADLDSDNNFIELNVSDKCDLCIFVASSTVWDFLSTNGVLGINRFEWNSTRLEKYNLILGRILLCSFTFLRIYIKENMFLWGAECTY